MISCSTSLVHSSLRSVNTSKIKKCVGRITCYSTKTDATRDNYINDHRKRQYELENAIQSYSNFHQNLQSQQGNNRINGNAFANAADIKAIYNLMSGALDNNIKPNKNTYFSAIKILAKNGKISLMMEIYTQMRLLGFKHSSGLLTAMLLSVSFSRNIPLMNQLQYEIQTLPEKLHYDTFAVLVFSYFQMGSFDKAFRILDTFRAASSLQDNSDNPLETILSKALAFSISKPALKPLVASSSFVSNHHPFDEENQRFKASFLTAKQVQRYLRLSPDVTQGELIILLNHLCKFSRPALLIELLSYKHILQLCFQSKENFTLLERILQVILSNGSQAYLVAFQDGKNSFQLDGLGGVNLIHKENDSKLRNEKNSNSGITSDNIKLPFFLNVPSNVSSSRGIISSNGKPGHHSFHSYLTLDEFASGYLPQPSELYSRDEKVRSLVFPIEYKSSEKSIGEDSTIVFLSTINDNLNNLASNVNGSIEDSDRKKSETDVRRITQRNLSSENIHAIEEALRMFDSSFVQDLIALSAKLELQTSHDQATDAIALNSPSLSQSLRRAATLGQKIEMKKDAPLLERLYSAKSQGLSLLSTLTERELVLAVSIYESLGMSGLYVGPSIGLNEVSLSGDSNEVWKHDSKLSPDERIDRILRYACGVFNLIMNGGGNIKTPIVELLVSQLVKTNKTLASLQVLVKAKIVLSDFIAFDVLAQSIYFRFNQTDAHVLIKKLFKTCLSPSLQEKYATFSIKTSKPWAPLLGGKEMSKNSKLAPSL
jgi:hypothetical protein